MKRPDPQLEFALGDLDAVARARGRLTQHLLGSCSPECGCSLALDRLGVTPIDLAGETIGARYARVMRALLRFPGTYDRLGLALELLGRDAPLALEAAAAGNLGGPS